MNNHDETWGVIHKITYFVKKIPDKRLSQFFIVFGAVVLSGAIFPFLKLSPSLTFLYPHLLYQLSIILLAVLGLYLLAPLWQRVIVLLAKRPAFLLLWFWMLLSLFWTVAPHSRVSMAAGLVTATLYGIYLLFALQERSALRLLALTSFTILVASGVYSYGYSFIQNGFGFPPMKLLAGLYSNKNILVRIATFSTLLAFFLLLTSKNDTVKIPKWEKIIWGLTVLLGLWMIFQYYSFTAKIAILAATLSVLLVMVGTRSQKLFVMMLGTSLLAGCVILFFLDDILALARETSGLKNRLYHWSQMLDQSSVSIWHGAGMGGFWDRVSGPWKDLSLRAPLHHGHNGFIDIWLDLGIIGLLLFLLNLIIAAISALKIRFVHWSGEIYFMMTIYVVFLFFNMTESSILPTNSANTFLWAIFVILVLSPASGYKENDKIA